MSCDWKLSFNKIERFERMKSLKEWNVQNFLLSANRVGRPDVYPGVFSGQRFLEIRSLRETLQLQQTHKRPYGEKFGFFHLGTPKTAFLMKKNQILEF